MNNKFLKLRICILFLILPTLSWGMDKIQGNACYTYGDNESLVQAEQVAKTLAIRNALESYSTFIESTTKVTDFQLSSDLITNVSSGQVKGVKILKRLQSGRQLCFTVEGYVEPSDLKKAIDNYLSTSKGSSEVKLQENEWIRIIKIDDWTETAEGYNKGKRFLSVYIEFLKYCKGTKKEDYGDRIRKSRTTEEAGRAFAESFDDPLRYRCDYRTTVFATFYNADGIEIETKDQIPLVGADKNNPHKWKYEILPGEKEFVMFYVPAGAKSWKVWVPK